LATRFVSEGGTDTYEVACGLSWSGIWTNLYQNFEAFKKFGIGYSGAPYGCHSILCLMCAKCKMFIFEINPHKYYFVFVVGKWLTHGHGT
jgi:hypothetical protein